MLTDVEVHPLIAKLRIALHEERGGGPTIDGACGTDPRLAESYAQAKTDGVIRDLAAALGAPIRVFADVCDGQAEARDDDPDDLTEVM